MEESMDTIGKKIRDLEQLKKELEELDLAAEVLTPGRLAEDATLLVCLPSVDEVPDDLDDIESEDLHLASECWWIWMIQEKVLPDI